MARKLTDDCVAAKILAKEPKETLDLEVDEEVLFFFFFFFFFSSFF